MISQNFRLFFTKICIKGGMQGVFVAIFYFGVSNYIGHYKPFGKFFLDWGRFEKILGPTPNFSIFYFTIWLNVWYMVWRAPVLRIPEHFFIFSVRFFYRFMSKNVILKTSKITQNCLFMAKNQVKLKDHFKISI
jgi:hypothetical protein